jgi:calcium/calmodulin-dependent protein kinase I
MSYSNPQEGQQGKPQVQACRYKTGKTLGAGSYSVVKECVHIDTGRYYAAKVINKRLMAGREHMVNHYSFSLVIYFALTPLPGPQ